MPVPLQRLTTDLEGTIRDAKSNQKTKVIPVSTPFNWEVDARELNLARREDHFLERLQKVVDMDCFTLSKKATSYLPGQRRSSYQTGYEWVAVQLYRRV